MSNKDKLNKDYEFFESQLDNLIKTDKDKFVIVKDEKIIDILATSEDALKYAMDKKFELGTFIIQKISKEPEILSRLALG